jgi:hypothetical protein
MMDRNFDIRVQPARQDKEDPTTQFCINDIVWHEEKARAPFNDIEEPVRMN